MDVDKAVDVDVHKGRHQELTVEPVHNSSVSGNDVSKIFYLKSSLESRRKESSKWADDGGKERHKEAMDEEWVEGDSLLHVENPPPGRDSLRQGILLGSEHRARLAAHRHPLQLRAVLDRADEVRVLAHDVGQTQTHEDGRNSASNESFPGLLRAEFNKRSSAHEEAKHVGHDVIDDDHHDRHDEPDEALNMRT